MIEEKKKRNHKKGRPSVFTPDTIQKLEYAYSIGCTDTESALYANISLSALYNYIANNPDFKERRDMLKKKPILLARKTVYDSMEDGNETTAKWLLEHKANDEYNTRSELSVESVGILSIEDRQKALDGFLERFE